jgi:PAS domain S-box-containing protein
MSSKFACLLFGKHSSILMPIMTAKCSSGKTDKNKIKEALPLHMHMELWGGIFHILPDPTYIFDLDGNILEVNNEAVNVLGYSRESFLEKKIMDIISPEYNEVYPQKMKELLSKKSIQFESSHVKRSGEIFPVYVNARLITIKETEVIIVITRDISELKATEKEFRESRLKYKSLFDAHSYGIFLLDEEYSIVEVNEYVADLYQYEASEMIGVDIHDLFSEETIDVNQKDFVACLEKGESSFFETTETDQHGNVFYTEVSLSRVKIEGENHVMAIVIDITDRKRAELALLESERIKSFILDSTSEMFTFYDRNYRIVYTNNRMKYIPTSYAGKVVGEKCHTVFYGRNKLCKNCHIEKAFKNGKDTQFVNKTIGDKDFSFRAYPIKDNRGDVIGVAEFGLDVTEENKVKEKLKQSEARFKALSNATFESVFIISKGYAIETNQAASEMFAYSQNELQHIEVKNLFRKKDAERLRENLSILKEKAFELMGVKKSGEEFHAQIRLKAMDYQGRKVTVMAIRDISYRKKSEALQSVIFKIANSVNITKDVSELINVIRLELSRVIDTSHFVIRLYDEEKDRISSPSINNENNSTISQITGKSMTKYLIQQSEGLLLKKSDLKELIRNKEIDLEGDICEACLGVVLKASSKIIGALFVQSYDNENAFSLSDLDMLKFVSTQIGLSIERKMAEDKLRENEEKLRAFFNSGLAGNCFCSKNGKVYSSNKAFREIVGWSDDKGDSVLDWRKMTPEEFHSLDEQKQLEAKIHGSCSPYEKQLIRSDGKLIWVLIGFVLLGKEQEQMIVFLLDLTDRKNFEEELKRAKLKAEESDRLKTAFLANMSHEIRTPMNAIVGFTSFLGDPYYSENEKAEFVTVIKKNVNALLSLIDDIIDISKIESGEVRIKKTNFSLLPIVREVYKTFSELAKSENSKLDFRLEIPKDVKEIIVYNDANRLRQVLTNLISNAYKFTEAGHVSISVQHKKSGIEFCVSDTGIGMTKKDMGIIFDRFSQAKNTLTREHGGAGLGLTITKNLVHFMGGDLWVKSTLGEGSKFYFDLPLNDKQHAEGEVKQIEYLEMDDAPDWKGKKILVAEDIDSNYLIIEKHLAPTSASLVWVKNGEEAVGICKQDKDIDAVLMDVQMPLMNGYDASREIKAIRKDLPIVAITAFAMSNEREKSKQAGCDEYIAKPIRKQRLLAVLHKLMHK